MIVFSCVRNDPPKTIINWVKGTRCFNRMNPVGICEGLPAFSISPNDKLMREQERKREREKERVWEREKNWKHFSLFNCSTRIFYWEFLLKTRRVWSRKVANQSIAFCCLLASTHHSFVVSVGINIICKFLFYSLESIYKINQQTILPKLVLQLDILLSVFTI